MKNTMNMNDKQPTINTRVSSGISQLPFMGYHGGGSDEKLPGGGLYGGEQTEKLPGGGFHGGEQTEKLPGGGFHSCAWQLCHNSSY